MLTKINDLLDRLRTVQLEIGSDVLMNTLIEEIDDPHRNLSMYSEPVVSYFKQRTSEYLEHAQQELEVVCDALHLTITPGMFPKDLDPDLSDDDDTYDSIGPR